MNKRNLIPNLRQMYMLATANAEKRFLGALTEPLTYSKTTTVTNWPFIDSSTRAFLLASAAAATIITSVHCEAQNNNANDKITETQVRQAIHDLWLRVDEHLHRLDASKLQGQSLPKIAEPVVEFINGQGQVIVTFDIPQQLNVHGATSLLRKLLSSPQFYSTGKGIRGENELPGGGAMAGASTSDTSSSGPKGVARRLRRQSSSEDSVVVDILEPYNQEEPARFEFRGVCTSANLKLLEAVMLQAAQPVAASHHIDSKRQRSRNFPGWFGNLGSAVDDEIESGLEEFFEPLREMMKEFERMHGEPPHGWSGGGGGGDRDGFPPFHLPQAKRFDYPDIDTHSGSSFSSSPATGADKAMDAALRKLRDMGCQVFLPHSTVTDIEKNEKTKDNESKPKTSVVDWGPLAGYNEQKRAIEDCLLLPLVRPEVYDGVARGTREKFAPNRPRAVLFVGPPGTGKTSSARVIASQAAVPLVYIPLESLGSKWYGESEKKLAEALAAADSLPEGCIIFLDELDALATSRSGDMHEATRRLLGVLLRHMDGFDTSKRSVIVGATNRAQDLDNALLSRFSAVVEFGLPDETCRRDILKTYAKNLKEVELLAVAAATPGMAGRDLRDICEQAERKWAAKIIRGQALEGSYPPVKEYLEAANARLVEMAHALGSGTGSGSNNLLGGPVRLKSIDRKSVV